MAVALLLLVLFVYWQAGSHAFVNFDDDQYLYDNLHVLRGLTPESVSWAFTTLHAANWHPVTWISHMLDVELFGASAGWHHRMSALLHLLNTEMLFFVLWRMTGGLWQSAFVAALFGVHPLHVESVAWASERKDVLSTLFWMLSMGAYLRYVRRPGIPRYLSVVGLFALGLMAKPMLVTLPFVLLLLDFWPLGRLTAEDAKPGWKGIFGPAFVRLAWEKFPLFALSAASCAVTYVSQSRVGAIPRLELVPFGARLSNALVSYAAYLGKAAWPSSLAVFYPLPRTTGGGISPWEVGGAVILLAGISLLLLRRWRCRPFLAVGWLWYLGTLVPVIGLVQVGSQAMADRYTYVPLIGIFIAMAWGIPELFAKWRLRGPVLGTAGILLVFLLSGAARVQASYWRDSLTLASRARAVTDKNWLASTGLGAALAERGQFDQAIPYYEEALRFKVNYALAWNNLSIAYSKIGQLPLAASCARTALQINPRYANAWENLGVAYAKAGQTLPAIDCYRRALEISPDHNEAWNNLGVACAASGRPQEAIRCFEEALRLRPDYATARHNMDLAQESQRKRPPSSAGPTSK